MFKFSNVSSSDLLDVFMKDPEWILQNITGHVCSTSKAFAIYKPAGQIESTLKVKAKHNFD